jgi:putative proteasome-type protease
MTYCVAAVTDRGIVFASDSRTNAGVDQLAIFSKMTVFEAPDDRVVVLLSAGNLASTQSVISLLKLRMRNDDGEINPRGIIGLRSLYDVATLVGETMREVVARDGPALMQENIDPGCTFIMGGQIKGKSQRLFRIYAQGNFIESSRDTNFFQIGETKYGKPIIDRVVNYDTSLKDVAKCLLVSFNSTMRSNLSVGPPIELLAYEKDALRVTQRQRFTENDPYFAEIGRFWSAGLRRVFAEAPDVPWIE